MDDASGEAGEAVGDALALLGRGLGPLGRASVCFRLSDFGGGLGRGLLGHGVQRAVGVFENTGRRARAIGGCRRPSAAAGVG